MFTGIVKSIGSVEALKDDRLIISTDDERIAFHVKSIGGEVIMTSSDHRTGTDRCGEVINKINYQK